GGGGSVSRILHQEATSGITTQPIQYQFPRPSLSYPSSGLTLPPGLYEAKAVPLEVAQVHNMYKKRVENTA
ncbi:hypothetical protein CSHISOI_02656, partial [Colletotrichum shisoi]